MMANEPITREETLLNAVATGVPSGLDPITREEMYLAYIGGLDVVPPEPITRKEQFLSMISPGGGSGVVIKNQNKTFTKNGTYKADSGYTGLGAVTVNVESTGGGVDEQYIIDHFKEWPVGDITINSENFGIYAFYERINITSVNAPNCKALYANCFFGCTKLTNVNLPVCRTLAQSCLGYTSIEFLDLPVLYGLGYGALASMRNLKTLVLRFVDGANGVSLGHTGAFTDTPFANGRAGGTIYVPQALIDNGFYTTATNWSAVNEWGTITWKAIEGSEYE